jgi:WD40 repeat protein
VPTLQVVATGIDSGGDGKEIFTCAYTPDSGHVLTGGWDGNLRLWDATTGSLRTKFSAGPKPLSACAISGDGRQWLSGSMDGMLTTWEAATQQQTASFVAHTRPISTICFAGDGQTVATASWDKRLTLCNVAKIMEGKVLAGHEDIVAGCRFLPDMTHLMSWSHDGTLRIWDVASCQKAALLTGHLDRINHAAVSPDGRWIASASRDCELKLWEWRQQKESMTIKTNAEVRGLFFLLDNQSLVAVDQEGWLTVYNMPRLAIQEEVESNLRVQCGELAPSGTQIVLGCEDGKTGFVNIEGVERAPISVTATPTVRKPTTSGLFRLLGKARVSKGLSCTCPVCQHSFEIKDTLPGQPAPCPNCKQTLRFSGVTQAAK